MDFPTLHRWDLTPAQAVALQNELAVRVDASRPLGRTRTVAGCDISNNQRSNTLFAAVIVLRMQDLEIIESVSASVDVMFPYVPGLLSFRECPPLLAAFARLKTIPDVVVVDGQGIAHPRRLGIASHLGLWLDIPTVGCGKSKLTGQFEPPGPEAGDSSPLVHRGEVIGVALRTTKRGGPVFVSPGHRIDLESAVRVIRETGKGYRLPEPRRLAHTAANEARMAGS
jgi:deoxyribonuclease V